MPSTRCEGGAVVGDGVLPLLRGGVELVQDLLETAEPEAADERFVPGAAAEGGGDERPGRPSVAFAGVAAEHGGGEVGEVVDLAVPGGVDGLQGGDLGGDVLGGGVGGAGEDDLKAGEVVLEGMDGAPVAAGAPADGAAEGVCGLVELGEQRGALHDGGGEEFAEHDGLAGTGRPVDGEHVLRTGTGRRVLFGSLRAGTQRHVLRGGLCAGTGRRVLHGGLRT